MKAISLLLLIPLIGCSLAPLAELEDHYFQCTSDGAQGCNLIAEEIDRRYLKDIDLSTPYITLCLNSYIL